MLILPAKQARRFDWAITPTLVGVAPSFLGPAGLLFAILSSERPFARLTLTQATLMAGAIALALEFAQILPLVRKIYTFDWLDVVATLSSLAAAALLSTDLRRRCQPRGHDRARRSAQNFDT